MVPVDDARFSVSTAGNAAMAPVCRVSAAEHSFNCFPIRHWPSRVVDEHVVWSSLREGFEPETH